MADWAKWAVPTLPNVGRVKKRWAMHRQVLKILLVVLFVWALFSFWR